MSDAARIQRVIQTLASAADGKDWATLRGLFADEVDYDYTSVAGGTPSMTPADTVMAGWRQGLNRFASTKHNFSDLSIDIAQTTATAAFTGQATHVQANGDRWTCGGDYLYVLSKIGEDWKVTGAKFVMQWEQGSPGCCTAKASTHNCRYEVAEGSLSSSAVSSPYVAQQPGADNM